MTVLVVVVVGACIGVLSAASQVPHIRWAPMVSAVLLGAVVIASLFQAGNLSMLNALILVGAAVIADALYAGRSWMQLGVEPGVSYGSHVLRSITHRGYLRRVYETRVLEDRVSTLH